MKFNWIPCVVIVAFVVMCNACLAQAQTPQGCGFQTLNGSYAFRSSGTSFGVPGSPDGAPSVFVGVTTFDGQGIATTSNTGSIAGFVFDDSAAKVPSSYTVDRDCTGTITVHFPFGDVHWNIVISDNGKKILAILKDPGFVFSAEYTKQ